MGHLFLIGAFVLNATANILLKMGAAKGVDTQSVNPFLLVTRNGELVLGLSLFVLNAFLYFMALRTLPLLVAYPVMVGMSFVIVGTYAIFVLGEQLSVAHGIGLLLILAGVILSVLRA